MLGTVSLADPPQFPSDKAGKLASYLVGMAESYAEEQKTNDRVFAVALAIAHLHQVRYIRSIDEYYYYNEEEDLFRSLTDRVLDTWATKLWMAHLPALGAMTDKLITSATNTFKKITASQGVDMSDIPRNIIRIAKNLYWDVETAQLVSEASGPVFFRLYDSDAPTRHTVVIPPLTPTQVQLLRGAYDATTAELERTGGDLAETFPVITTWACQNHDVYMDIMRVSAYCFTKKKPSGAVLLMGKTRNGKSSYIGLMHSIFGTNNTSQVKMSQVGDAHYVAPLTHTLFNAPDEVDKKPPEHTDYFKTITDHGTASFPKMNSGNPVDIRGDFMCFFPLNHFPKWGDTEASALVQRSWIIPFDANLRGEDNKAQTFEEQTYTPEFLARFTGTILGIATYAHTHGLVQSARMLAEKQVLAEESNSAALYFPQFQKFFDGFTNWTFLYEDYQYWCRAREVKCSTRKELEWEFREYKPKSAEHRVSIGKERLRVRQISRPNHHLLHPDFIAKELREEVYGVKLDYRTIKRLHEQGISIVYFLNDYYEDSKRNQPELPPEPEQPPLVDDIFK